jgi:WD40 repeat protein/tRNA A-37 threonylcarbamoyl transferase component Bud32
MTPGEITPIDAGLLEELLAADAALAADASTSRRADWSWADDCLRLLEMIRSRAELPEAVPACGLPLPLGRFEIVREVGRGGFGVVYLARDPVLGREVALKVPRPERLVTTEARRRFMREARAAAGLDHPNIVPVYEACELGPITYIAAAYCEGRSLSEWLKAQQQPVPAREAARLIATLAGAVQHAHEHGILHRDLKPGNIMLQTPSAAGPAAGDLSGMIPRVMDFGLAKLAAEDGDQTHSGSPLGSPPYMAPEQAAGRVRDLGPPTDVYGLGAILYEVLTGRSPFRGQTPSETIRQVIEDEPIAPRVLRRDLPRDLETVCLHCLNKDLAGRYPSAVALAADLERFLAGEPIHARPASLWERGLKWARRRPAHAALAALAAIVGIGAAGGITWSNAWLGTHNQRLQQEIKRADRHAEEAERQQRLAEKREALADRHLHAAQLRLARQAYDVGQFERVQEVLLDDVYGPGPRHRDFAWRYLWRLSRREVALLGTHQAPVRRVDLSPDGRTLASCDAAGGIILWDTSSSHSRVTLSGQTGAAWWIVFSPDSRVLASCGEIEPTSIAAKHILIWDVVERRLLARPEGVIREEVGMMSFLAGGRMVAVVTNESSGTRTVRAWDLASDAARPHLRYVLAGFGCVVASPDGRLLAVREPDGRLTLRDAMSGQITRTVSAELKDASPLAVSPDGRSLAAASTLNRIFVWDLTGTQPARVYSDNELRPDRLSFSPDGSTLVAVTEGRQVSLRDLATGRNRVMISLAATHGGTFQFAFSRDGSRLALHGLGHHGVTVPTAVWRVATASRERVFSGRQSFQYLSFAADGASVYLGGDHDLALWPLDRSADFDAFTHHHGEVWAVAFSTDGATVASGGKDTTVRLWDPTTGRERAVLRDHQANVAALAFRPDGRVIASGGFERQDNVKLWEPATGRLIKTLSGHTGPVRSVAFSSDGGMLASAGSDRTVRLWDGATGALRAVLTGHDDVIRQVALSLDGLTLASASHDRTVRLWDMRSGQSLAVFRGRFPVSSVSFSLDGRTLASADRNGYISLWNTATRSLRLVINADDEEVRALAFSPDGNTLATAGVPQTIRLWDSLTGQELLALGGSIREINALAFSPDGGTLAAADNAGLVRLHRGDPD